MKVLVDTSVWSLALRRRRSSHPCVQELQSLIRDGRVAMMGAVRQELLSGIRQAADFASLRVHLRAFEDEQILSDDHERAAEMFNACRVKGIQGSNTDFLMCALAERRGFAISTTDRDFDRFAQIVPVRLHVAA